MRRGAWSVGREAWGVGRGAWGVVRVTGGVGRRGRERGGGRGRGRELERERERGRAGGRRHGRWRGRVGVGLGVDMCVDVGVDVGVDGCEQMRGWVRTRERKESAFTNDSFEWVDKSEKLRMNLGGSLHKGYAQHLQYLARRRHGRGRVRERMRGRTKARERKESAFTIDSIEWVNKSEKLRMNLSGS